MLQIQTPSKYILTGLWISIPGNKSGPFARLASLKSQQQCTGLAPIAFEEATFNGLFPNCCSNLRILSNLSARKHNSFPCPFRSLVKLFHIQNDRF